MATNRNITKALIGILFGAVLLRFAGVWFGLPDIFHADEPIVVNHAVAYGTGDLNPHFFKIPPLVSYLLFVVYGLYFVFGSIIGLFDSVESFQTLFLTDPTSFYLIARILFGVVLGTATVYAVYCTAFRMWKDQTLALISAFFMAVCFLHVRNSHYIYADIPMTLFVVLTAFAVVSLYDRGTNKDYIMAAILGGIATGFKYNAAVIAGSIFLAHVLRKKNRSIFERLFGSQILLAAGVMVGTYLLTNPYSLLDARTFISDLVSQAGAENHLSPFYHIRYSLAQGMALPLLLCGLGGLLWLAWNNLREFVLFFSFPILFYVFCIFVSQEHARYMIPVLPFICMAAGYFLRQLTLLKSLTDSTSRFIGLAVLVAGPTLIKSVWSDVLFVRGDVRNDAKAWIEIQIPTNSKIALDHTFFGPSLRHSVDQLSAKRLEAGSTLQQRRIDILMNDSRENPSYDLYYLVSQGETNEQFLFSRPVIQNDWNMFRKEGIEYIVIHHQKRHRDPFYASLHYHADLIKTFSPYSNAKKINSIDPDVNTGAPFVSNELYSRRKLGYTIQVYKIR